MTEITKDTFPKHRAAAVFDGMPAYLKDPKNYDKVRRVILESLAGKCSHSEVVEWAACAQCQKRFAAKGVVLKRLGFTSPAQYLAWQKVHETIKRRVPFAKYNS